MNKREIERIRRLRIVQEYLLEARNHANVISYKRLAAKFSFEFGSATRKTMEYIDTVLYYLNLKRFGDDIILRATTFK
jgi:hypothetical protein